ncbi:DNA primase [Pseudarthrobacter oxydans]|uniref:DNA primase n=2 Tax=Pseudarthrobacter oxydans TaxID=1671 RepID=A0AAW8NDC2_PSEOX|nr:toprim domain-containing protein [Pseudarthrobacter oxydans]MDR6794345.1 DNA primase [Pseudarthrobacter oxydans]MDR7164880.1 DNA primase [Pseudarthrobacter oxydans]
MSPEGESLLAYLTHERALSLETIKRFQLGAVLNPVASNETARGWISIPYLSPTGVLSMRFRRPPGSDAPMKYWSPKGTRTRVYNTSALVNPGHWLACVEGEIDCATAEQAGIPAIGIPGVQSWAPYMKHMLSGFSRILVLADNDDNGQGLEFAEKIADQLDEVKICLAPKGHDVNSTLKELGAAGLRAHFGIDKHAE